MSIRSVVSSAIRTKLLTVPELSALRDANGNFKYVLGIAEGQMDVPYIRANHTYGGELTRTPRPDFDQLWQICAISSNQPSAEDIDALIYLTLVRTRLDYADGWKADQDITFNGNYADDRSIQGVQYWIVGGYYRIRGSK